MNCFAEGLGIGSMMNAFVDQKAYVGIQEWLVASREQELVFLGFCLFDPKKQFSHISGKKILGYHRGIGSHFHLLGCNPPEGPVSPNLASQVATAGSR